MTLNEICSLLSKVDSPINEAVVPPFDWNVTLSMINRWGKKLTSEITPLIQLIKTNEQEMDDFGLRNIGYYLPDRLERFLSGNYHTTLEGLISRINELFKTAQNTDDPHFSIKCISQYIPDYIGYFLKDNKPDHWLDYADDFKKFNENKEYHWYNEDDDFKRIEKIVIQIQEVFVDIRAFDAFLRDLQKKLEVAQKWSYGAYNDGRKFRPEDLQPIEIGYHASLQAKQLMESGFRKDHAESESFGLGGRSYEGDISITLDFKVAQTIAWVYKHLWLIAHNQWKLSSVFEFVSKYSKTPKSDKGGEYTFVKIVEIFKNNKGQAKFPPKDIETLMEFFVHALWFVNTPINKNPVFFGFDGAKFKEKLLSLNYNDIGVLKVEVKTDKISEFLTAERELRVPPEDIKIISII